MKRQFHRHYICVSNYVFLIILNHLAHDSEKTGCIDCIDWYSQYFSAFFELR